ncbi:MAG TPA: hypothetical protein VJB18_09265 [Burkholderiales bacterium]|nr:hypothetical protein [Burkholderiales bacterium]
MDHARCPFEKVILGAYAGCEKAQRFFIAERMGVECTSDIALNNCLTLIRLVRENARFALKVTDTTERLPFGKEMKIMVGGLTGLEAVLHTGSQKPPGQPEIRDIHGLVQQAQTAFGSLTALPYPEIMKSVAAFQLRKRHAPGSEKGA